ncbi:MAG: hypothetical protein ACKVU4_07730 [Phycisphaerales bacterium]
MQVNTAHLGGEPAEVVLDDLVKHFAYDGLGRLIRVQSPYPTIGSADRRSERFFYDGIRRVQEITVDPLNDTSDSLMAVDPVIATDDALMAGGEPGAAAAAAFAAEPDLDGSAATLAVENSQLGGTGSGSSGAGGGVGVRRRTGRVRRGRAPPCARSCRPDLARAARRIAGIPRYSRGA